MEQEGKEKEKNLGVKKRYAITVLGEIDGDELGFTLPHEHIFWDLSPYISKDKSKIKKEKITLKNVANMKYNRFAYPFNVTQQSVKVAVDEMNYYKQSGGI